MRDQGYKHTLYTVLLQTVYFYTWQAGLFSEEFEKSCKQSSSNASFWYRNAVTGVLICGKKDPSL